MNSKLKTLSCSFSILFIHLLGDMPSPILTGYIQDRLNSWEYTMTIITSFLIISSLIFILQLILIKKSKKTELNLKKMYNDL